MYHIALNFNFKLTRNSLSLIQMLAQSILLGGNLQYHSLKSQVNFFDFRHPNSVECCRAFTAVGEFSYAKPQELRIPKIMFAFRATTCNQHSNIFYINWTGIIHKPNKPNLLATLLVLSELNSKLIARTMKSLGLCITFRISINNMIYIKYCSSPIGILSCPITPFANSGLCI